MPVPKIAILATFHMGETDDMHSFNNEDILFKQRQKEIKQLVDQLVTFKPSKLAVEVEKTKQDKLNERYNNYLEGNIELEKKRSISTWISYSCSTKP